MTHARNGRIHFFPHEYLAKGQIVDNEHSEKISEVPKDTDQKQKNKNKRRDENKYLSGRTLKRVFSIFVLHIIPLSLV